jgi:glycosyltransferase involved in cell wall biosynthesis
MRVGLLVESTGWGGMEHQTATLARALSARGHEVTIACLSGATAELFAWRIHGEAVVECVARPRAAGISALLDWRRALAGRRWDICVYSKGTLHAGGGCAVDLAARGMFGTFVTWEHGNVPPIGPRTRYRHFGIIPSLGLWRMRERVGRFLRSVGPTRVICVSETNRSVLVGQHHFSPRKVVTIRNGIDVRRFRRNASTAGRWRERHGIPVDSLVFGTVTRLVPLKRLDLALEAFEAVLRRCPGQDFRMVIVGDGPEEAALRRQAEVLGPGRVILSPFSEAPWEAMGAIDVFVLSSLVEGLPLALAEAMACGCAPVATAVGGVPELLASPDLGWLVPPGDVNALADAMHAAAAAHPAAREAMGARGRARVSEHFDARAQIAKLVALLESLVPASGTTDHPPDPSVSGAA